MTFGMPAMCSRLTLSSRFVATLLFLILGGSAAAQTPHAQTSPARKDRVYLKDVEGIWINEAYMNMLASLKSPHAAAKKAPPLVIAIRREGRTYPIVVTDFNKATLQAVLDIEPDGRPGAYRLVVAADDKPKSSSEVKYIRFEAAKNAQGKFDRLRIAEPDFMKGKWTDYIPVAGELSPQLNRLVIAGHYSDEKGRTWIFGESGEATWPEQKFNYELSLNDPGANCDYLQSEGTAKASQENKTVDDRKRYGYGWKAGKLSVYPARLAGRKWSATPKRSPSSRRSNRNYGFFRLPESDVHVSRGLAFKHRSAPERWYFRRTKQITKGRNHETAIWSASWGCIFGNGRCRCGKGGGLRRYRYGPGSAGVGRRTLRGADGR